MADDATTPLSRRTAGTARRLWGLVYVRALAYLVAGAVLLADPAEGLSWLRWVIGLAVLAQGALLALENIPGQRADRGDLSWRFVAGLLSVAAGLLVVLWPSMTGPALFLVVGVWACVAGVAGVVAGLRGRAVRAEAWDWQLVNAVLWVVLGVVVLARPTDDTATIALVLSTYLLLSGAVLLVAGLSTGTGRKDRAARGHVDAA